MGFPTGLSLLTEFTGANGTLKNVEPFGEAHVDGTTFSLERKSNALGRNVGGTGGGLLKNKATADNGQYITISTLPETAEGYFFWAFRVTKTGATWNGYGAIFIRTGTSTWVHQLRKYVSGASSVLGANLSTTALAVGDKIGYSVEGTTLKLWREASGSGTWTELGSRTDATYSGEGNVAIEATNAGVYDNLFGGTITSGGTAWTKELADTVSLSDALVKGAKKALADTASTTDAVVKKPAKALADTAVTSDAVAKSQAKVLADTQETSDSLARKPTKSLSDTAAVSDAVTKTTGKVLADTQSTSDALIKSARKTLADSQSVSDGLAKKVGKVLADTVSVSDSVSASRVLVKLLADTVSVSDALVKGIGKRLSDTAPTSDSLAKKTGKKLADTATVSDSLTRGFRKLLADTVSLADEVLARLVRKEVPLNDPPTTLTLFDSHRSLSILAPSLSLSLASNVTTGTVASNATRLSLLPGTELSLSNPDASLELFEPETTVKLNG